MKIEKIKIKGFLGIDNLDMNLDKHLVLVAGGNCTGKTSILHGLMFCLTDELCRVEHKKDVKKLVRDGHKVGNVEISVDGVSYNRSASTGHYVGANAQPKFHQALPYCLNAMAFIALTPNERREFLFKLMGVSRSQPEIVATLESRGHQAELIASIAPQLLSGFKAAHQHVRERATLRKGEWRGVTGEEWGSVKAEGWSCEVPGADISHMEMLRQDIARFNDEIGKLQEKRGALAQRATERVQLLKQTTETRRIADGLEARMAAAKQYQRKVDELVVEERQIREALEKAKLAVTVEVHAIQGTFFECPACNTPLVYSRGECKVCYEPAVDVSAEIAASEEHVKELELALHELRNLKRITDKLAVDAANAVGQAQAARGALTDLADVHDGDTAPDAGIEEQIRAVTVTRASAQQALERLEAALHAHNEAAAKTSRARAVHEEIKGIAALAADLAPDGLPAELLSKAMRPINQRLRDSAAALGFHPVTIDTEGILIHGRHWSLASESEHWRANAIMAEAISHLSGLKIFTLDGFDVLAPAGRAVFLAWLISIAHEHDTIIILATLKQAPVGLPPEVQSCWLSEVPDEMHSC